jgi:hypothetical protein
LAAKSVRQQLRVDGEADDIVATYGLQQHQRGLAAIMPVAAYQDLDVRPMPADAGDDERRTLATSSADGRLPGLKRERTGLPVRPSKMWICWKHVQS